MKINLDITKPHYSEHIFPVPWSSTVEKSHFSQTAIKRF